MLPKTPVRNRMQSIAPSVTAKSARESCRHFRRLLGIEHQMTDDKIAEIIHAGKGRMPGFPEVCRTGR